MTMKEAVRHLKTVHKAELSKLPLKARSAKLADLLARYRKEHPEESAAWSAAYA